MWRPLSPKNIVRSLFILLLRLLHGPGVLLPEHVEGLQDDYIVVRQNNRRQGLDYLKGIVRSRGGFLIQHMPDIATMTWTSERDNAWCLSEGAAMEIARTLNATQSGNYVDHSPTFTYYPQLYRVYLDDDE
jgi:hypothetical protein